MKTENKQNEALNKADVSGSIFGFNSEQKELLKEMQELENTLQKEDVIDEYAKQAKSNLSAFPEKVFVDERKKLTVIKRMEMAENIQAKYSMLNKPLGIFKDQLFSAMEEYLKQCEETGYRYEGL